MIVVACDRDGYLYSFVAPVYGHTGGLGLVASVWSAASETPRGSRDGGEWSGSVVALLLRD